MHALSQQPTLFPAHLNLTVKILKYYQDGMNTCHRRGRNLFLWHNIWSECGRPRDGLIAYIMRRTRAAYHYAIRNVKRNSSDIIKQRLASAIVENRNKDFWHELKKVNGRARDTQKTIDGHTDSEYIADMFAKNTIR